MSKPAASPKVAPSATVKGISPQASSNTLASANETRTQAAKEILSTEESYTNSLGCIVQMATAGKALLTLQEIKVIFGQAEMLWKFHVEFLKEITAPIKAWSSTACVGNVFEKNADVFKLYTPYVNSYPDSAYMLAEKQKNKTVAVFLREQQLKTPNKLDLASLLIMPIQRVPRYRMLIELLLKNTQPTHPDYASLANALEKIKVVADAINEKKKKAEMIQKVNAIQDQFEDEMNLVESFRVFVAEGTVTYYATRGGSGEQLQYFMFNDKMLLAAKHKQKLKLRETLDLVNTEIKDVMDTSTVKNSFELLNLKASYVLTVPTLKEKEDFIKDFYLQRSRAAALLSGPKLAVEVQKAGELQRSSVYGGSGSGSHIEEDKEKEKKEREKKERKEKKEREALERKEKDERARREQMEAELAKTKAELALARAETQTALSARSAPAPVNHKPSTTTISPASIAAPPKPPKTSSLPPEECCTSCGEELTGKLMKIGDRRWHKNCFVCKSCKGPVPAEFNLEDGWPICDPCYSANSATRCPGCHNPIIDKFIKALNKEWHKECFVCYKCGKGFPTGQLEVHPDC